MYYLYLEFKSASLIITKSDGSSTDYRRDNKSLVKKTTYKVDLENPLKVNHISNMLHCMFGFPPVPSMIDSIFEVNEKIYDLALNHSYIKYDNKFFYLSKKGEKKYITTSFWSNKANFNSDQKVYSFIGGKKVEGNFTWVNFHSQFKGNKEMFALVMNFFNELFECKNVVRKFTFPIFLEEIKKHIDSEKMKSFKEKYGKILNTRKLLGKNGWYDAVFEGKLIKTKIKHNSSYSSKLPILNTHGFDRKKVIYNGKIIVEIEDESLIDDLKKYGRIPTIMDGGIINILGIKKIPPMFDWKEEFTKISE